MSRVKFDYIVSFSSEDPAHPASNLLSSEVTKKKWLCADGAKTTCSVVLGVARAVKVSSVTIGAHMSAMVELLVGRSEKPDGAFEVLVPSSVFMNAAESRKADKSVSSRVRSFHVDVLCDTRNESWDRFKVICSQPYNTHCQFGLSFVMMTSSDLRAPTAAVPSRMLATDTYSSDDDDAFKPGDMFRMHLELKKNETDAGKEIREASRNAMSRSPQPAALVKNPIVSKRKRTPSPEQVYNKESHVSKKINAEKHAISKKQEKVTNIKNNASSDADKCRREKEQQKQRATKHSNEISMKEHVVNKTNNNEKQFQSSGSKRDTALRGVVFVLSGYENPLRAQLRESALSMGASYSKVWDTRCTHLICAFPNTPKLREVRSLRSDAPVCTGDWLLACHAAGALLPWRPYATEKQLRPADTECDTDDEIEKVVQQQAADTKQHCDSTDSDVSFVQDERLKGQYVISDNDDDTTVEHDEETVNMMIDDAKCLANFLEGYTVMIDEGVRDAGFDADSLRRYVVAYGGQIIQEAPSERDDKLLILCTKGMQDGSGKRLRPDWLWECHQNGEFVDYNKYLM